MLKLIVCAALILVTAGTAVAQEPTINPLAELQDELAETLATAGVPFSEDQTKAVALMMEERRRASEELFGNLMDFRGGPTQGQDADRLNSAIDWMRSEFLTNLTTYLTSEQAEVWDRHRQLQTGSTAAVGTTVAAAAPATRPA